jgi:TP901 family phage tail tape measure protein
LRDNKGAATEHATGIKAVNDALGGLTAPLSGAIGGLKEFAEIAGIAFVGEMVGKVVEMAKLGETTIKLAASVGTTPQEFSSMSAAMRIAGSDAESAARTMERLASNLDTALRDPSSKAADAFRRLGITEEQLKGTNGDLEVTLKLLADAFLRTKDSMQKTDAFREILGRGFESLVQYLMRGSAGIDEFKKRAEETGAALNNTTIRALADTGEKMNSWAVRPRGSAPI